MMNALVNPYWEAIKNYIDFTELSCSALEVVGVPHYHADVDGQHSFSIIERGTYVRQYSWTIPDPTSLTFIVDYSRNGIVDPMAGTGYWARLLCDLGKDVVAYDIEPKINHWHRNQPLHFNILPADAVDAVQLHHDRTLLLSWPPYDYQIGTDTLNAYQGDQVIYISEGEGGCCGDDSMFDTLNRDWLLIDEHIPVRWFGVYDVIQIYDRKN